MHSPNLQLLPKDFNIEFESNDEQLDSLLKRYNSSTQLQPFIRHSDCNIKVRCLYPILYCTLHILKLYTV